MMSGEDLKPVFVVSSGRSGTTLLRAMLNAGGDLHIPHESDYIARAFPLYAGRTDLGQSDHDLAILLFRKTSQDLGWGLPFEYLKAYLKKSDPATFKELNVAFVKAYLEYNDIPARRWGIKAPVLIASVERILAVFPNARIVHLVRDGRDVHLSYRAVHERSDVKSFGPNGVVSSALYWVDGLRRIAGFSSQVLELRYEDLLSNPAVELERLCSFVGIAYAPEMHTSYSEAAGNRDAILSEHRSTIHAKISGGLDSTNTRKYMARMKTSERFVFELLASPYLAKYGYELEYPFLTLPVFWPMRATAYSCARLFNQYRYSRRDKKMLLAAKADLKGGGA